MIKSLTYNIFLTILVVLMSSTSTLPGASSDWVLEYKVTSVNTRNWIITAQEIESGNIVKFKLHPSVFKGQTFSADLGNLKIGASFSPRGEKNASLKEAVIVKPLENKGRSLRYFNWRRL